MAHFETQADLFKIMRCLDCEYE